MFFNRISLRIYKGLNRLLLFTFIFYLNVCSAQTRYECVSFKNGLFVQSDNSDITIKRTSKYQYEENKKEKRKSKLKIKWINECEYILTLIRTTDKNLAKKMLGVPLYIKIIEISGPTYTYSMEFTLEKIESGIPKKLEFKQVATLVKIK